MAKIQPGLLQAFYLSASAKSWTGGGAKTTIPELPGSKVMTVEEGPLRYKDIYFTYPGSEQSFGQTIIWIHDSVREVWLPAWNMQYGGYYPERFITFLKAALRQAYEAKQFIGGRGPLEFTEANCQYLNHPEEIPGMVENKFHDFKGEEEILVKGARVGFHWYRGQLLIPKT